MALSPELHTITRSVAQLRNDLAALPSSTRLSAQETESIFTLAYNLLSQGHHDKARKFFSLLTLYRPDEARYLLGLAVSYQMLQRYDEAIAAYAFASGIETGKPEHMLSIAECQLLKSDTANARFTLGLVIRFCSEQGGFAKTQQRAEALLALLTKGDIPARS